MEWRQGTQIFQEGDALGTNGFIFLKELEPQYSMRGQRIRIGKFICPKCKKEIEENLFAVVNNKIKDCGCSTKRWNSLTRYKKGDRIDPDKQVEFIKYAKSKQYDNINRAYKQGWFQCPYCGKRYIALISHVKQGRNCHCGCQKEKHISKGERKIKRLLEQSKIIFESEKRFKDCKDYRYLPFDFYLPDYNCCIEYDGRQHYESIQYFGGNEEFIKRQQHDNIKNQYCKDNNIKLIRIPYWDYDKLNEEYLLKLINE